MRKLPLLLLLLAAPLAAAMPLAVPSLALSAELGDLSPLRVIAADTLRIVRTGDLAAAQSRVTDFETAWDAAAGTMQPMNPAEWTTIDHAADTAIGALRAKPPVSADADGALVALLAALDHPQPAAPAVAAAPQAFAVTNPDGSPLPCEVALKSLRDAAGAKAPTDKAAYDTAVNKGLERCNADDDKRADGFFAAAFALLG